MGDKERLLVLHHDDADGFTCAWIHARYAQHPVGADYMPVQYGQPVPPEALTGRPVMILDFSYPNEEMKRIAEAAKGLLCIDHHRTAEENCRGLDAFIVIDKDNNKAACKLTWEWYFTEPCPAIVHYVDDRDRWRFELPYSREINEVISVTPFSFSAWDGLAERLDDRVGFLEIALRGSVAIEHKNAAVQRALRHMRVVQWEGTQVPVLNTPMFISETGHEINKDYEFSATWFQRADGRLVVNLRSRPLRADVSEIAKKYGGGGHKHAAGFTCDRLPWDGDGAKA